MWIHHRLDIGLDTKFNLAYSILTEQSAEGLSLTLAVEIRNTEGIKKLNTLMKETENLINN